MLARRRVKFCGMNRDCPPRTQAYIVLVANVGEVDGKADD